MQSTNPFRFYILLFGLLLADSRQVHAASLPADVLSQLNSYNEVWASPSTNGSPGSMPIGNGDITANVWVENGGDLMMYIGKSDSWSEGTRLLKIGRTRLHFSPNPFTVGAPFSQALDFYHGEIDVTAGQPGSQVSLRIWADANQPVIRVEASGQQNFTMSCSNEVWRSTPYTPLGTDPDPPSGSWRGVNTGWTESATIRTRMSTVLLARPLKPLDSARRTITRCSRRPAPISWFPFILIRRKPAPRPIGKIR